MRVLVAGAHGQLGRALGVVLGDRVVAAPGREELDIRDTAGVQAAVAAARPDVVINAAAYNRVDAAEADPEEALAVNAKGPLNLARAAASAGALLVHVSTDYVFDGAKATPYEEGDAPRPLSVYGLSKRAGEMTVEAAGCALLLVRTSAVFGPGGSRAKGGSFIDRILERARAGQPLRVVRDQVFAPTYAPDLASAIVGLVSGAARGLVHVTNAGACSWHELAVATLETAGLPAAVEPITTADLGAAARRPAFSVLSGARYRALGLGAMRPWREALGEMLRP